MDSIALLILAWILRQLRGGKQPAIPTGPPPKFPQPAPIPGSPAPATATTYTIQSGDTGFGLATRYTGTGGRWREILTANPSLRSVTRNGVTQIDPWQIGQVINWPPGWAAPGSGASPGPSAQRPAQRKGGGGGGGTPQPAGPMGPAPPTGWVNRRTDQGG